MERILAFVGYHTLTIELLAKQAQERYISIVDLIAMLEKSGISIPKRANVAPLSSYKTKTTIKHLLETFIIDLDKDSLQFLRYFSILPSVLMSYKELVKTIYDRILPENTYEMADVPDILLHSAHLLKNLSYLSCFIFY